MEGMDVGSWVLESKIGEGGMGEVWLGRHKSLDTYAAIKAVSAFSARDPELNERFSREARTQAQLSHPNVARVLDHVEKDGRWYLVIEYLDGGTLRDVLNRQAPVPLEQSLTWVRQALGGLAYAHQRGIIHRDIKPANILLNQRGEAAVTDFGLARLIDGESLTRTGHALGTPAYMSPEQIDGRQDLDGRTDLYSMGVVLYELVGGRVPFPMKSTSDVFQVLIKEPPPLRELNPSISPELEGIVLKALAKNREERFSDAAAFIAAIDAWTPGAALAGVVGAAVPPPPPDSGTGGVEADLEPTLHVTDPSGKPARVPPPPVVAPPAASTPQATPTPGGRRRSFLPWVAVLALVLLGTTLLAAAGAWLLWGDQVTAWLADAPGEDPERADLPDGGDGSSPDRDQDPSDKPDKPAIVTNPNRGGQDTGADRPGGPGGPSTDPPITAPPDSDARLPDPPTEVAPPPRAPTAPPPTITAPPPPAPPAEPRIAVISLGDRAFARPLEAQIEARLRDAGLDIADERGSLFLNDLLQRGDPPSPTELAPHLLAEGFDILVLTEIEIVSEQELRYHQRRDRLFKARLDLRAFLLSTQRALGGAWSEKVDYTDATASIKAEQALLAATSELARALRAGWQDHLSP